MNEPTNPTNPLTHTSEAVPPPPAPDHPAAGNNNEQVPTEDRDAGMYEAGIPGAIERRLIHVDRVTEETLVQVRAGNSQTLALITMVALVGLMVWLVARDLKGLTLE